MASFPFCSLSITSRVGCAKLRSTDLGVSCKTALLAGEDFSSITCACAGKHITLRQVTMAGRSRLKFMGFLLMLRMHQRVFEPPLTSHILPASGNRVETADESGRFLGR